MALASTRMRTVYTTRNTWAFAMNMPLFTNRGLIIHQYVVPASQKHLYTIVSAFDAWSFHDMNEPFLAA